MELIDREKLKQQVDPSGLMFNNGMSKDYKRGFTDGLIRCYELITRQPTVNTWISVEDRLPKESGKYLIYCNRWSKIADEMMLDIKLTEWLPDENCFEYETGWCADFPKPEIIAWMPIPEYKEQEDD